MDRRSVQRYVAPTARAAGISRPIGPHALRCTVGTVGLSQGITLRDIQRLLRHARPETTLASYDISPDALERHASHQVAGVLAGVGPDWVLLEGEQKREHLVALAAVRTVAGLGRRTAAPEPVGAVRAGLDLRRVLRGLARDRSAVQLVSDDGGALTGTLDRVGADYVELAVHPSDEPRRRESVQEVRAVVIGAVAVVRTVPPGFG